MLKGTLKWCTHREGRNYKKCMFVNIIYPSVSWDSLALERRKEGMSASRENCRLEVNQEGATDKISHQHEKSVTKKNK